MAWALGSVEQLVLAGRNKVRSNSGVGKALNGGFPCTRHELSDSQYARLGRFLPELRGTMAGQGDLG